MCEKILKAVQKGLRSNEKLIKLKEKRKKKILNKIDKIIIMNISNGKFTFYITENDTEVKGYHASYNTILEYIKEKFSEYVHVTINAGAGVRIKLKGEYLED